MIEQFQSLSQLKIRYFNEYPTMHYFGNPRHSESMKAYVIWAEYFWEFQSKTAFWECCPIDKGGETNIYVSQCPLYFLKILRLTKR